MKKGLFAVITLLLLLSVTAIGVQSLGSVTDTKDTRIEYTATFAPDTPPEHKDELILAVQRSVKTKFQAMGAPSSSIEIRPTDTGANVIIDAPSDLPLEKVQAAMAAPYDFQVMYSVPVEEATLVVNDTDGYAPSSITGSSLYWVDSAALESGLGAVRIVLDEPAQQALQAMYESEAGDTTVGVFVRNQLVAKLLVTSEQFDKDIRILNVPDPTVAQIFADDINVGRYVQFSQ